MEFLRVFRLGNGDRARVELRMSWHMLGSGETVTHDVSLPYGFVRVSLTGEVTPKGVRFGTSAGSFGQVVDDMPADLQRVWRRWHLNDMNAGCAHHHDPAPAIGDPCPVTGYRYGHSWLVDPLTLSGALDLLRVMDAPASVTVLAHDGLAVGVFDSIEDALAHLHSVTPYSWEHAIRHEGWAVGNVIGVPELALA